MEGTIKHDEPDIRSKVWLCDPSGWLGRSGAGYLRFGNCARKSGVDNMVAMVMLSCSELRPALPVTFR